MIELVATITVASIIAVTVIPATARIARARQDAAPAELARLLEHARALALATGTPHGVTLDSAADTAAIVLSTGSTVEPANDALGQPEAPTSLSIEFGADLTKITISPPPLAPSGLDTATQWFAHNATPQIRGADGSFGANLTSDSTFQFATGSTVTVRAISGLVEVSP